jgi:hypothetical protein
MADLPWNPEKRMTRVGVILVACGTFAVFAVLGLRAGGSFAAGGGLAALNLLWLRHSVNSLMLSDPKGSKQRILTGFLLRLLLIPLCLYVMLRFLHIRIPAAVAGFAAFHCSIFIEGILEALEGTRR